MQRATIKKLSQRLGIPYTTLWRSIKGGRFKRTVRKIRDMAEMMDMSPQTLFAEMLAEVTDDRDANADGDNL